MSNLDNLPTIFREVIAHDRAKPSGKVLVIAEFLKWKRKKVELTQAAERYMTQAKPGAGDGPRFA